MLGASFILGQHAQRQAAPAVAWDLVMHALGLIFEAQVGIADNVRICY
jgi:hypothetical protein